MCLVPRWRKEGGYYITVFICLVWLLAALTCIAYISHVSHLHSWSGGPWSHWLPSTAWVSTIRKVSLISHVGSVPYPHQVNLSFGNTGPMWWPLYLHWSAQTITWMQCNYVFTTRHEGQSISAFIFLVSHLEGGCCTTQSHNANHVFVSTSPTLWGVFARLQAYTIHVTSSTRCTLSKVRLQAARIKTAHRWPIKCSAVF